MLFDAVQKQRFELHCPPNIMIYLPQSILGKCVQIILHDYIFYSAACPRLQRYGMILAIDIMVLLVPDYRVML